jgi:hypothetical protein
MASKTTIFMNGPKKTVDDPAKKAKYTKSFAVYVGGKEVYEKDKADALEAELKPLVGGPIVAKMFKYDTDPPTIHSRRAMDSTNLSRCYLRLARKPTRGDSLHPAGRHVVAAAAETSATFTR